MRVLHWCILGVTTVLLVCEVTISQLCKSLIILVDGFHTFFILVCMAITPPPLLSMLKPPLSTLDSPVSPAHASSSSANLPTNLPADSSIRHLPLSQATTDRSTLPDQPPSCQPKISPPAPDCGLSYTNCRIQPVGTFISALLLASLCLSYIMEIISFFVEPQPAQRPLLLVVVSFVSLLHKMLMLWLSWDQQQDLNAEYHLEVNHKVLTEEEAKGQAEPGQILYDVNRVQSAVDDSLQNGALVLCNPGTSSIPDTDSQASESKAEVHLPAAAPQDSRDCEVASSVPDLSHSEGIEDISKDSQNASNTSPVCMSSHPIRKPVPTSQWADCLPSFIFIIQCLCTSLLALINTLAMLIISPQCLHSSDACNHLVYLDPVLSLVAVITLIAIVTPQVHRYGLLLLQATPPHICVSDLGRRIASIPGVQAVHDLHVWQLTESFMVASVHVHCHAGFPTHRCADLMSGVTKVLQSVGVSCCTIQPEFPSCSGSSAGGGGDTCPVVHREDPSLPPLLACNLACGKACIGDMCCSSVAEESRSLLAPPAGETKEEPQTLVIENTFL